MPDPTLPDLLAWCRREADSHEKAAKDAMCWGRPYRQPEVDALFAESDRFRALAAILESMQSEAPSRASVPDDIRAAGWTVAVHNDYRLAGEPHTFWLFTKAGRCVKGEGRTDAAALAQVRADLTYRTLLPPPPAEPETDR